MLIGFENPVLIQPHFKILFTESLQLTNKPVVLSSAGLNNSTWQ